MPVLTITNRSRQPHILAWGGNGQTRDIAAGATVEIVASAGGLAELVAEQTKYGLVPYADVAGDPAFIGLYYTQIDDA